MLNLAVCLSSLKTTAVTMLKYWCFDVPSRKCGSGHLVKGEG
jgi:hypothetical protein